ncbi:MAG: PIG-L family deacetylase [Patescibacteria group bacterium]|jgi:LmbE family N-acetylglucosaminyl deacetylase
MKKKLIIAPHVDDEVLGCGGILDADSFVYYCGIDESQVAADSAHRIPLSDRLAEAKKTAEFFGFEYEINQNSKVNFYLVQSFIAELERVINQVRPEMIFLATPGFNQDHDTIWRAAKVALRPHDKNWFVKKVLLYEEIQDFSWTGWEFHPNYLVPIEIERKIKGYELQSSQVRPMRSSDKIRALAKVRGVMANCEYAEGFQIKRWVE